MKTAIFIFDAITQVVLTPECDLDRRVCELIERGTTGTMRGSVYETRGGWIRFEEAHPTHTYDVWPKGMSDSESLIVRIENKDKNKIASPDIASLLEVAPGD